MSTKLYGIDLSFPYRACLITAAAIDLPITCVYVDLFSGEHRKPEFLKMNPQHTVPIINDDGLYLSDSHAIVTYLVSKYGKSDKLYPKDLKLRALVDRMLHFDSGIVFPRIRSIFYPILNYGVKVMPDEKKQLVVEAYQFLEQFISNTGWCVGSNETLADLCLAPAILSIQPFVPIPEAEYPKINAWLKNCLSLPYFNQCNEPGCGKLIQTLKSKMSA